MISDREGVMKIGILQTGRAPEKLRPAHGDYQKMSQDLLGLHSDFVHHYAVQDGEIPLSVTDCDAWFITGSRHGVYESHEWIPPLEDFIRSAKAENRKMVGVCFGHQIMAQALGGSVEKFEGGFSVGAVRYNLIDISNKGKQETLYAYHQDQVVKPPNDAVVIMTSDFCENAGLAYGDWGLSYQPHPEFSREYMEDLIEVRKGSLFSAAFASKSIATLSEPTGQSVKNRIRQFLNTTKTY